VSISLRNRANQKTQTLRNATNKKKRFCLKHVGGPPKPVEPIDLQKTQQKKKGYHGENGGGETGGTHRPPVELEGGVFIAQADRHPMATLSHTTRFQLRGEELEDAKEATRRVSA
jgi:hypothetical protein